MRKLLQTLLVTGVTLASGTSLAFAQASGTTGDLNPPAGQKSSSDTQDVQTPPPAAPADAGAAMPSAEMPMHHKAPMHKMAAHKAPMHHATGKRMASAGSGRACFPLAMQFDKRAASMVGSMPTSPKLTEATEARNKAMEACNAGNTKEGQAGLKAAMAKL